MNPKKILRNVLLSCLTLIPVLAQAQAPATQQCSNNPPAVTANPDGSTTVDLGTCSIFPQQQRGFDLTAVWVVDLSFLDTTSSITFEYSSSDAMTYDFHVGFCGRLVPCVLDGPYDFNGSVTSYQYPPNNMAFNGTMIISEHISVNGLETCFANGWPCRFSAKFTVR